jgi:hypothetical protein
MKTFATLVGVTALTAASIAQAQGVPGMYGPSAYPPAAPQPQGVTHPSQAISPRVASLPKYVQDQYAPSPQSTTSSGLHLPKLPDSLAFLAISPKAFSPLSTDATPSKSQWVTASGATVATRAPTSGLSRGVTPPPQVTLPQTAPPQAAYAPAAGPSFAQPQMAQSPVAPQQLVQPTLPRATLACAPKNKDQVAAVSRSAPSPTFDPNAGPTFTVATAPRMDLPAIEPPAGGAPSSRQLLPSQQIMPGAVPAVAAFPAFAPQPTDDPIGTGSTPPAPVGPIPNPYVPGYMPGPNSPPPPPTLGGFPPAPVAKPAAPPAPVATPTSRTAVQRTDAPAIEQPAVVAPKAEPPKAADPPKEAEPSKAPPAQPAAPPVAPPTATVPPKVSNPRFGPPITNPAVPDPAASTVTPPAFTDKSAPPSAPDYGADPTFTPYDPNSLNACSRCVTGLRNYCGNFCSKRETIAWRGDDCACCFGAGTFETPKIFRDDCCTDGRCERCCQSPLWFGSLGGLIMSRNLPSQRTFAYTTGYTAPALTSAGNGYSDFRGGFEARLGRCISDTAAIEATLWYLSPFSSSATAVNTGAGLVSGLDFATIPVTIGGVGASTLFSGSTSQTFARWDEIYNLEVNVLKQSLYASPNGRASILGLAGVRWFHYQSNLSYSAINAGGNNPTYNVNAFNDLVGPQLGARAQYYLLPNVRLYALPKVGIFGNTTSVHQQLTNNLGQTGFDYMNRGGNFAVLGQIDAGTSWQITQRASLFVAYRVTGVSDVVLSDNQVPQYLGDTSAMRRINSNGDLILQGIALGGQVAF